MRIAAAFCVWIVIVGGMSVYMRTRDAGRVPYAAPVRSAASSEAEFRLVVTPTFDLEPDPFALWSEDEAAAGLVARMAGVEVLRETERIEAGRSLAVALPGVTAGLNEVYVEASPPLDAYDRSAAVRVQVLREGVAVAEATFWSEAGGKAAGTLTFREASAGGGHGH